MLLTVLQFSYSNELNNFKNERKYHDKINEPNARHPNELLKEAVSGSRKVRFIPITGHGIDKLIAGRKYYTKTTIPVAKFT